jgi:hypothetical protein
VQPWSYLDIGIYALACRSLLAKNFSVATYSLLVVFAILNRETGVLLSIVPLLVKLIDKENWFKISVHRKELFVILLALICFVLFRWFQDGGRAVHVISVNEVISRNFSMPTIVITMMVYLGAFCWLVIGKKTNFTTVEKAFTVTLLINVVLIFFLVFSER